MSRFVSEHLPEELGRTLALDRALARADRAIVVCTVDEHGWPHPAMVSSLELVVRDPRNIRFALHAGSRSVRNLRANGRLTAIVVEAGTAYYIKGDVLERTASLAAAPAQAAFNLRVDSVLADQPGEYESATIVSDLRVARARPLSDGDLAVVRALLAD
jgi:flavin reductase (DIM6/NTAB) family NADH-FMN oxidoreductase RutF